MLLSVKEIIGMRLKAKDGVMGHLKDVYFDDRTWEVRWLVAGLGSARISPKVLIDPRAVKVSPCGLALELGISLSEVRSLPPSSFALPVCHQYASPIHGVRSNVSRDPHLRSCLTLLEGYALTEQGENVGTLIDFCLDTRHWELLFLSVRPENVEEGSLAIHSTDIVRQISNAGSRILVQRSVGELLPVSSAAVAA